MNGLLKSLGVRTRRVADLDEGTLYVADCKLLLLDFEIVTFDLGDTVRQILEA